MAISLVSTTTSLIGLNFSIIVQQFKSYVLTPSTVQSQAHIPELLVIIAIFAGGAVDGILVALVALPVSGVLKVLVIRVVAPIIRHWSGAERASATSS